MSLQPFTDNFTDNSSEAGFQFTFNCALCGEGYQTKFISSKSYKKEKQQRPLVVFSEQRLKC